MSADDLARYLGLKEFDGRLCMFEAVSAYDGWVDQPQLIYTLLKLVLHKDEVAQNPIKILLLINCLDNGYGWHSLDK